MSAREDCHWTEAQKDAYEQIEKIMREHFESGTYTCLASVNDNQEEIRSGYHGGKTTAIGLCRRAEHHFLNSEGEEFEG